MSMFFVFVWGEDDSVCLVSSARSFFWSCALSLNVSCLLEVLAIVVGFFFITELEAEVIIFSSLLNTIVLVSLYCQRFGSFRRPCKIATILNLLQSPREFVIPFVFLLFLFWCHDMVCLLWSCAKAKVDGTIYRMSFTKIVFLFWNFLIILFFCFCVCFLFSSYTYLICLHSSCRAGGAGGRFCDSWSSFPEASLAIIQHARPSKTCPGSRESTFC